MIERAGSGSPDDGAALRNPEAPADPAAWFATASQVFAAAERLWPEIEGAFRHLGKGTDRRVRDGLEHRGAFYLLAGLAIEHLAKALIILDRQRTGEPLTDVSALGYGRGYPLPRLIREGGLTLTASERGLLLRLSASMRWKGRYPAPTAPRQAGRPGRIAGTGDLAKIRSLLERLQQEFRRRTDNRDR